MYDGGFNDGKFHGDATLQYVSGAKLRGYYHEGKEHGWFTFNHMDGKQVMQLWDLGTKTCAWQRAREPPSVDPSVAVRSCRVAQPPHSYLASAAPHS